MPEKSLQFLLLDYLYQLPKVNSDLRLNNISLAIGNTLLRKIAELIFEKWYIINNHKIGEKI